MPASSSLLPRLFVLVICCALAASLRAEVSDITISKQYGLPYLAVVLLEQHRLSKNTPRRPVLAT